GQVTAEAVEAEAAPPTPGPPVITVTAEPVDNDQSTVDATKEKQEKEEEAPFPAGQVLLGAGSALTLGSVALASAVGPWGLLLAPGAVAVGGGVFLATRGRRRSKRGRSSERAFGGARSGAGARPVGRVGGARLGGGGRRSSGGGRGGVSPTHGGGRPAAARSVGLGARPAPTSRTAPWSRGGAPRPGAGGRAVVAPPLRLRPAAGAGGRVPGGGAGVPGGGGASRRVGRGSGMGPAPRNRWGASQQPSAHPRGGLRRAVRAAGRRAADWADDRSGRRLSTGWRAAKDQPGFRAAHKAARDTRRSKKRGPATEVAALVVAVASWLRSRWARRQDSGGVKENDKKSNKKTAAASTASAGVESGAVSPAGDADVEETPPPRETTSPSSGEEDSPEHTSTTRGGRVSTFPLLEIAAEMQGAAAKYSPETMWQVIADAEQLPGVIDSVASSIRIYLERLVSEQYPVDTAVIDQLGEVYRSLKTAAAQAEEVGPMIRNIHQHDVDRREAPRGDETRWNV